MKKILIGLITLINLSVIAMEKPVTFETKAASIQEAINSDNATRIVDAISSVLTEESKFRMIGGRDEPLERNLMNLIKLNKNKVVQALKAKNFKDSEGTDLLLTAAINDMEDLVKFLVKAGVYVNIQTEHTGMTPLMLAAFHGYANIVEFLLQHGADPNIKDKAAQHFAKLYNVKQEHLNELQKMNKTALEHARKQKENAHPEYKHNYDKIIRLLEEATQK